MKKIFFLLIILAVAVFFLLDKGRPVGNTSTPTPVKEDILPTAIISLPEEEIETVDNFGPLPPAEDIPEIKPEPEIKADIVTTTPVSTIVPDKKEDIILLSVPFISQAPLAHWDDPRQQDGCEEAGALMAIAWAQGDIDTSPAAAEKTIIALADWEQETYGEHRDVYIDEVESQIFQEYFNYNKVESVIVKDKEELITALRAGKIILAPTNGQALHNPNFKAPGPERHLVVVIGYDAEEDEFITNDPGTRLGAAYRYPTDILFAAIRAYPTGYHLPIVGVEKKVLLVEK